MLKFLDFLYYCFSISSIFYLYFQISEITPELLAFGNKNFFHLAMAIILFSIINIFPAVIKNIRIRNKKLRESSNGVRLLNLFLVSTLLFATLFILMRFGIDWKNKFVELHEKIPSISVEKLNKGLNKFFTRRMLEVFIIECVVFWNGIIRVYLNSRQLGIKTRIIGFICGMIPVVHLIVLFNILRIVSYEVNLESEKELLNEKRKNLKICCTKYPVLLVHGVFFRDFKFFNYWGRIPEELEKNGCKIFYGNQESALSVKKSGEQLAERVKKILAETNSEKVNIIAHSKGGLDTRYMIAKCGCEDCVASLTTINTPHRGCEFADYLLEKIPEAEKNIIAQTYNFALKNLGDKDPDLIEAVTDLTCSSCEKFNREIIDSEKVFYQSVGSKLNWAKSGTFPLNYSYRLVEKFDGPNDGLVGEKSFKWGSNYRFVSVKGIRGISHGDMIDLNRENIPGFDVREFYVQIVKELKDKGF